MKKDKSQFGKNLKHLRKALGFTQTELAEKIYTTESVIGKLERGEYEPNAEILEDLSKFFRVPINMLMKEELSEYNPKYKNLSIDIMKNSFREIFPIISSEKALQDSYFKEAYEKINKFLDDGLSGKPVMTSLFDSSLQLFHKSFDENETPEAFINLFCILLLLQMASCFDDLGSLYHNMYICRKDINEIYNKRYFYNANLGEIKEEQSKERIKRREVYREFQEVFCDGIGVIKRKLGYVDFGDYLFALTYLLDFVDNLFDQHTNLMIGVDLLANYAQQGNCYAKNLMDKIQLLEI